MGPALDLALRALVLALTLSTPVLIAGALAAAIFGLLAGYARVTEPSITHVPRVLAVAFILASLGGVGFALLVNFTHEVFTLLPRLGP